MIGSSELQRSSLPASNAVTSSGHAPYCVDSVERYFRSLREAAAAADEDVTNTATSSTAAAAAAADDDDDDDDDDPHHSYGAALKRSFSARVDSARRSLLQSLDTNNHLVFTGLTSNVKGRDLEPCDDVSEGHNLEDVVNVRYSEDFVYEDSEERKRATVACLPDALRQQLMVDLAESMDDCTLREKHSEELVMTSDHPPTAHPSDLVSACVTDSVKFDYVDLSADEKSLPQDLKDELRLDLRDSTDCEHLDEQTDGVASTSLNENMKSVCLPVLRETPDDDDDDVGGDDDDVAETAVNADSDVNVSSCTAGKSPHLLNTSHQQQQQQQQQQLILRNVTHQSSRLQSSAKYRKSSVPGTDVLKPVPSKTRPQTAVAAAAAVSASKKKSVVWSRDVTTTHADHSSPANKLRRPASACLPADTGRHASSASANQHSASSSVDELRDSRDQ